MNLEFEYGQGLMSAQLPEGTDVFIPGETIPDPPCLPQDWESLYAATLESIRNPIGMPALRELAGPGKTAVAVEIGGHQEEIRQNPGRRGGEAGGGVAEHRHQQRDAHSSGQLQHPRQGGQGGEAHALDQEAEDVHQGQGEVERPQGQQVLPGHGQEVRALCV